MSRRACGFTGCARPHSAKGYCSPHYMQAARGDALRPIGYRPSVTERILANSASAGECIIWHGHTMANGYGVISWGNRQWLVHRAVWTEANGSIPDGLTVDHLCRNRACVNVGHMEIVTRAENSRRGGGLEVAHASYRARTHCRQGHEYTPENTARGKSGGRSCRECNRQSWHKWAARSGKRPTTRGRALLNIPDAD